MVRTTALLWLLAPCGWLVLCLNDSGGKKGRMQEQEFVELAMSSLRFEIEAGGYAYAQGTDRYIIEGGARLASDYGAACTQLAELAASKGLRVPDVPLENEQQMLDGLMAPEGGPFDQKYTEQMALWYGRAIELFAQAAAPGGVRDDELRQWAAEKLSMLSDDAIYQAFRAAPEPSGRANSAAASLP
ncbi:DUF4142 domain-containing protein [Parapedobacter luteus]|nr:DUF4142 domain-containing protein [Parapedobacter luteus]